MLTFNLHYIKSNRSKQRHFQFALLFLLLIIKIKLVFCCMACLKTCKKRQDLFSAEQSEIENKLISFRSVFYGNMVDTDFFLNHALLYSFTNFRDTSDSHQLHVFLFSYKLPTCLFLGHSTARYGKIGL